MHHSRAAALLSLALAGLAACGDSAPTAPTLRAVDLDVPPALVPSNGLVHWRFVGDDGHVFEGDVAEPGLVRAEFDEHGHAAPAFSQLPWASRVSLDLPDIDGTVEWVRDGVSLGQRRLPRGKAPMAEARQGLGSSADVLGPPTRLVTRTAPGPDVLILSEGFTVAQMPTFRAVVNDLAARLIAQAQLPVPGTLGFLVQEVASRQPGADDPATGTSVDTAFDVTYGFGGTDRCIFFGTPEGLAFAHSLRQAAGASVVVAIANSAKFGGCANGAALVVYLPADGSSATRDDMARGINHELGHALFGLADEYDTGPCTAFVANPNVASSLTVPWADLIPTGTPLPTFGTSSSIGAFEGAQYCTTGKYRPAPDCRMRSNLQPFCAACQRERERLLRAWSGATIEREPNGTLQQGQTLQASDSVRGVTGSNADVLDFYRVSTPFGECVTVQLFPPAGTDLDLSLTDAQGRILKTSARVGAGLRESATQCGLAGIAVRYRSGTTGSAAVYRLETTY